MPRLSVAGGPVHGGKAGGMGTAFVAIADDPSAILFNAAGLAAQKGTRIYAGTTALTLSSTYKSLADEKIKTEFQVFAPPFLYISSDLSYEDIVFGVGIYSPYGIGGREWDETGPTRYRATKGSIGTLSINPTIAWQASPVLSIGGGLNYVWAMSDGEKMLDQSAFGVPDGTLRIESDGGAFGFNVGALIKLSRVSVGFAYRNRVKVNMKGEVTLLGIAPALQGAFGGAEYTTGTEMEQIFPEIWSLGLAYRASKALTLAFDYELVRWSSTERLDLYLQTPVPAAAFTDSSTVVDWKDSNQFKVGAEYLVSDRLALRGGYAYITTFVPEHTLGPDNPDSDQHNFAIGLGYEFKKFYMDAFYNVGIFEKRDVNNTILSGEYESTIHYLGNSIGYHF